MKNKVLDILDDLMDDYDRDITLDEINLIKDYITNLQDENKSLKTHIKTIKRRRKKQTSRKNKYKDRIDKAIEYIESYNLPKDLGKLSEAPISVNELKELLKILKGGENGNTI